MVLLQQVRVLHRVAVELVRVVRNVDFLLADERPVVTLGTAVVHVVLIGGTQVVRVGAWIVERDVRRATYAALARVVDPRTSILFRLIQRLVHQQDLARESRRLRRLLHEERDDVVERLLAHPATEYWNRNSSRNFTSVYAPPAVTGA